MPMLIIDLNSQVDMQVNCQMPMPIASFDSHIDIHANDQMPMPIFYVYS